MGAGRRFGWLLGLWLVAGCGAGPQREGSASSGEGCHPASCALLHVNCGEVSDGCGGKLSCGSCDDGETCGGGGTPNVCGASACSPATCASLGANCGTLSDGCGNLITCGQCEGSATCGGSGLPHVCGSR